jgi:tetratricopeptide (TPR) repeat protein
MTTMPEIQGFSAPGRIVTITNPYVELTLHQAMDMRMQGNYQDALEVYDRVLEMDPYEARAYHGKGDILDYLGRYDEAISCYDSALECDPSNAETWYNKGVTLRKAGRMEEGAECMFQGVSRAL